MRIQAFAVGIALAWAGIGAAQATDVQFTITGGDRTATFQLPLSPTPGFVVPGFEFVLLSVPAAVGGTSTTFSHLIFYKDGMGRGGFADGSYFSFSGPQFYTGSESSPTFVPGIYSGLVNENGKIDTVTVAELAPVSDPPTTPDPPGLAVPELSTWAMLALGFFGLGYASYRKLRTSTTLTAR
jgi:hypothetical protein